jgi:hypothetical protein
MPWGGTAISIVSPFSPHQEPSSIGVVVDFVATRAVSSDVNAAANPAAHSIPMTQQSVDFLVKQISDIKILKSITFADAASYEIPQPTAIAIQIRRECAPY